MPTVAQSIARDGRLSDIQIEKSSGNLHLDNSGLRAIIKSNPFPPLPADFKGDIFEFGVRFTPSGN
jgi:colicin import membrane protein